MDAVLGSLLSARGGGWAGRAAAGAVAFWCLGVIALAGRPVLPAPPVACPEDQARLWCAAGDPTGLKLAAAAVLVLLLITGTAALVGALTPAALTLICGEGPRHRPLIGIVDRATASAKRRRGRLVDRLPTDGGALAGLAWYPTGDAALRPTRAGNAFAALSQRVRARHGIDLSLCWPLFEAVLPDGARDRIEEASNRALRRTQNLIWAVVALGWAPLLPRWAGTALVVVAVGLVAALWVSIGLAVVEYCALVEALVLAHRATLYRSLGWPAPAGVRAEPATGRQLTVFLTRMGDPGDVAFSWADADG